MGGAPLKAWGPWATRERAPGGSLPVVAAQADHLRREGISFAQKCTTCLQARCADYLRREGISFAQKCTTCLQARCADYLRREGISFAQAWPCGRPTPIDELLTRLAQADLAAPGPQSDTGW